MREVAEVVPPADPAEQVEPVRRGVGEEGQHEQPERGVRRLGRAAAAAVSHHTGRRQQHQRRVGDQPHRPALAVELVDAGHDHRGHQLDHGDRQDQRGEPRPAQLAHPSIMRGGPSRGAARRTSAAPPPGAPRRWPKPGGRGELADVVDADGGPAERRAAQRRRIQHGPLGPATVRRAARARPPPGPRLRPARRPGAAGRPGRRRCRRCRRRAARSASGPRPGSRSKTSRRSADHPRATGLVDGLADHVDAQDHVARAGPAPR